MEENQATPLLKIIVDRIGAQGPLTFADYMAACLYEPGLGYYTSPGRKVGAEGDFYTSSNVHEVFGRLIGREISRMWEVMGQPPAFQIVEVGAGNGRLACDILNAIADFNRPLYTSLTYRFIEAEPTLADAQHLMLGEHAAKGAWSTPADLAAGTLAITGCIFSNELIDALPTHLVEMTAAGLQEVFVTARDGELAEVLEAPSTPELQAYLDRIDIRLMEGQRAEINLAVGDWLAGVARSLAHGFLMTIDYGFPAVELYSPHRLNGTLLCYHRHTIEENPYIRPGQQDITSHVDFTSLSRRGAELGLEEVWFGEQYRFLMGAGMMEELLALEARATTEQERIRHRLALKKLLLPDGGMGDTFKVLIQARGVENPRLLCMRDWGNSL